MKRLCSILAAMLVAGMFSSHSAWAAAEWKVLQTIKPGHTPIDLMISSNAQRIYVLDDQGWISIYTANGQLTEKIEVGTDVRQIKAGPGDNMLFLLNRTAGTIQIITIDFVENIDIEGSAVKGRPDAPVSIVVFSDFQCPYCARLVPVLEQVFEQNPEKVKIVFKNFPIRGHAFAVKAAQAVLAANSLGKFWEFHDLLFKNHNALSDGKIEEIRTELGLDADQFKARMNDPQVLAQINAEANLGRKVGVRGTPTVFVNGRLLRDKSPKGFEAAINKALQELPASK